MRGRADIYDYKKQLDTLKGYLEKQGMSPANKDSIEKFIAHCQIMDLSDARIIRYYYAFKHFNIFFGKDFNAAMKEDVEAVSGCVREIIQSLQNIAKIKCLTKDMHFEA